VKGPKGETVAMALHRTKEELLSAENGIKAAADHAATIALLEKWGREDATEDPAAIAQAERDLCEFKAAMNANRPADRPIFP
jgi:hypothetical protein